MKVTTLTVLTPDGLDNWLCRLLTANNEDNAIREQTDIITRVGSHGLTDGSCPDLCVPVESCWGYETEGGDAVGRPGRLSEPFLGHGKRVPRGAAIHQPADSHTIRCQTGSPDDFIRDAHFSPRLYSSITSFRLAQSRFQCNSVHWMLAALYFPLRVSSA